MANLSALSTITTAANGLANLILVNPQKTVGYQPQNAPTQTGVTAQTSAPIAFHYEGEQTALLESDITDHFVEDNTAIQDQISLKPIIITTHGFIGELNDLAPNAVFAALQTAANKLTVISGYTPGLSLTALNAYNQAVFLYETAQSVLNSAVSAWSSISGSGGESVINGNNIKSFGNQTKQQQIYQLFFGYWANRILFTVQTPWAVFEDMAIKSLRAVQDADTNTITDFEVTFKQIRFASNVTSSFDTSLSPFNNNTYQQRLYNQGASPVNLGTFSPQPAGISLGSAITGVTG